MYDCMVVLFWCFVALNINILVYSKLDLYPPLQIIMDCEEEEEGGGEWV